MNTIQNSNVASNATGTPIPGVVGWTYEDVMQENKHIARARRITRLSRKPRAAAPVKKVDDFEAVTGWSRADALAEAIDYRRDERLFGARRYH